jgi:hypothetical protein
MGWRGGHPSEEELILHYYGEAEGAAALDAHLEACAECRGAWAALSGTLGVVTDMTMTGHGVPEFGAHEVTRAWDRLRPSLHAERARRRWRPATIMVPLALAASLINTAPGASVDIASEQVQAQELVGASRLYRQAVTHAGEPGLASVLEELERLLVEISHRPSSLTPEELTQLRQRIESRGLLFKVRVLESEVREKEKETMPVAGGVS